MCSSVPVASQGTQKIMNNLQLSTGQLGLIIKSDEKVSKLNLKYFFVLIKKHDINFSSGFCKKITNYGRIFLTIFGIWATIIYRKVSLQHALKNNQKDEPCTL